MEIKTLKNSIKNAEGYMDTTSYEALKNDLNHYHSGDVFYTKNKKNPVIIVSGSHRETDAIQTIIELIVPDEVFEAKAEAKIYKRMYEDLLERVILNA